MSAPLTTPQASSSALRSGTPARRGFTRLTAAALPLMAGLATAAALSAAEAAHAAPTAPAPGGSASSAPAAAGASLNARVEASVVQLRIEWEGYLQYGTGTGYARTQKPVRSASLCTGFFVGSSGEVATAGHCVDPAEGRLSLIEAFLDEFVEAGSLTSDAAARLVPHAEATWKVQGRAEGSPLSRVVSVTQPKAVRGAVITEPLTAQVIDFKPLETGDVALLKVEASDTPRLSVASADPEGGDAVTLVGFPGSVRSTVDASKVRASFKTGTVSSRQITDAGVAETEVNADISGGMSGGPAINADGDVLGVNSSSIRGENQNFNFITDTTDLRDWLSTKGVRLAADATSGTTGSAGQDTGAEPNSGTTPVRRAAVQDTEGGSPWLWLLLALPILATIAATAGFLILRPRLRAALQH